MKRGKQAALVAAVVVALVVAVVVLAQVNRSDAVVEQGNIAITRDGKTLRTFTMAEVETLPSVDAKKTITSSSHADETGTFTGVPLRVLLAEVDSDLLSSSTQVVPRAVDGYVSSLDAEEVATSEGVLLVYAKNGESLGGPDDGGTGPFRIVILSDEFGNRCTKWVNEIEIM